MSTFTLSIETHAPTPTDTFTSYQHPFHLGTQEPLARSIAEEIYHARIRHNLPVVTVALMRDGKMVDCYGNGRWHSDISYGE